MMRQKTKTKLKILAINLVFCIVVIAPLSAWILTEAEKLGAVAKETNDFPIGYFSLFAGIFFVMSVYKFFVILVKEYYK